ncbi:GAF domain-containing protein [Leifsonia sp. 2MCAF36]
MPTNGWSVHAAGADSDRVLIFGSGVAVGFGVLSQDLALAGHLARALSARTRRGTDVDVVADASLTAQNALPRLKSIVLERYDAVIVVLGTTESLELASVSGWRQHLRELLDQLLDAGSFDVVVAGIPSLRSIGTYGTLLGLMGDRHSKRCNRASAELCAGMRHTTFVGLSPALSNPDGTGRAVENYRMWALEIAEHTAPLLDLSRTSGTYVLHDAAKSEPEREASVQRLGILHTPPETRFDRIVDQARMLFDASGAALAFIDRDRLWYKSSIGTLLPSIALKDSFTEATITERGAVMIPDARADARFRNLAQVTGEPWVRFWAGFPIEDQDGVRVGTLSVFDSEPRIPSPDYHPAVLRQFALMVQNELRQTTPSS